MKNIILILTICLIFFGNVKSQQIYYSEKDSFTIAWNYSGYWGDSLRFVIMRSQDLITEKVDSTTNLIFKLDNRSGGLQRIGLYARNHWGSSDTLWSNWFVKRVYVPGRIDSVWVVKFE